jgi:hypothetical protein
MITTVVEQLMSRESDASPAKEKKETVQVVEQVDVGGKKKGGCTI